MNTPELPEKPKPTVFALCSDFNAPLGGSKKIYRHIDILNRYGFKAFVLHDKKDFRCTWFENSTQIACIHELEKIGSPDYLILPEAFASPGACIPKNVKKIIFNQNCYYTFDFFTLDKNDFKTAYLDPELVGVLVVSEDSKAYLQHVFPHLYIHRIHNAIDEAIFTFNLHKKNQIAYMPRKHADELLQVINILKFRGALKGYELVSIENKTELEAASIMKDSLFFLSSGYPEGFSLSAAEAMACGCIVIGYHGMGGKEFFNEEYAYPVWQGDILTFAKEVEKTMNLYKSNPSFLIEQSKKAAQFIRDNYSTKREERDIVKFWANLTKNKGLFEKKSPIVHNIF